jgi:hypothetical protein
MRCIGFAVGFTLWPQVYSSLLRLGLGLDLVRPDRYLIVCTAKVRVFVVVVGGGGVLPCFYAVPHHLLL